MKEGVKNDKTKQETKQELIEKPIKNLQNIMEPIRNVKDSDKKDDDIYKTFINENGVTAKPEEEEEERSHNSSNKEENDKDTNDSISKVKKENNPKKNDTNNISQNKEENPFVKAIDAGKQHENNININQENNCNNSENNNNTKDSMTKDFHIFSRSNQDIINQPINESLNKIEKEGRNISASEDISRNRNKNLNDINNMKGLQEKNYQYINKKNSIFDTINANNNKALKQYKNTKTLIGHTDQIVSLIQLSSGYICTGSYDYSIKIWDITKAPKHALVTTKISVGSILCLLELKPNELLAGNSENCIDVFNLADKKSVEPDNRLFGHSLWVTALVKCDEDHFASASNDAKIFIWDSNKKNKLKELFEHSDCILTMVLLENGNLCTGSADQTIRIWDWKNEKCLSCKNAHSGWVKSVYQFNSEILLSGSEDKIIKIWNLNLDIKGELKGHKHSIRTFCKIDDNYFATGSFDNTIKIWDFNEKKCVSSLVGHAYNVICIIKYDDKLISCSSDKTIKIWE